ncbi:MAG: peptidylprolyl isomerase [Chloroflexi bacterium]|nr:peptidylprolyl isomerase [Chloroflexota bacterium]
MPKEGRRAPLETRKQQVRRAHEERKERILYMAMGAVALVVLLILAFGYFQENIAKLDRPIAVVNGKNITVREYQTRLRFEAANLYSRLVEMSNALNQISSDPTLAQYLQQSYEQQQQQYAGQLANVSNTVRDQMIQDALIRQEAAKRNLTVSADEIDLELEKMIGYERATPTPTAGPSPTATQTSTPTTVPTATPTYTPSPSPTGTITPTTPTTTPTLGPTETPEPTWTPMSFDSYQTEKKKYFDNLSKQTQVSESDLRRYIESALLRQKVQKAIGETASTTAEQVHARHILVDTLDQANQVQERLKKGEDFAALAVELSKDTGSKTEGGDLGWFTRGQMIPAFEDAAFSTSVNQVSAPITTTYGVHIIQVLGYEQNRALDASALQQAQTKAFNDWLQKQLVDPTVSKIEDYFKDEYIPADVRKIIAQVKPQ